MGTQQKDPALAMNELTAGTMESARSTSEQLGLYVHVPFCSSTCDFCAFYQVKPDTRKMALYFDGLEDELALVPWDRPLSSVFWGGGTPGLLSPDQLRRLGGLVNRLPKVSERIEWSVEMAPASVTDARLAALQDVGVTRISLGVQSLRPDLLDNLGRQHTREQALRAYERVRNRGFPSVNIDLMFALPGQEEDVWIADLQEALALQPDHVSTYCLTFEEDTALWVKLSQGKVKLDPAHEARLYERTWTVLAEAGYLQYEVSNFARPGHACQHNLNTWTMQSWVGLGPSAASQFAGERGSNPADLALWRDQVAVGIRAREDHSVLTPGLLWEDALIFGLRMNAGVHLDTLRRRFGGTSDEAERAQTEIGRRLETLVADGLVERRADHVFLTPRGRLLADSVGREIMGALQDSPA